MALWAGLFHLARREGRQARHARPVASGDGGFCFHRNGDVDGGDECIAVFSGCSRRCLRNVSASSTAFNNRTIASDLHIRIVKLGESSHRRRACEVAAELGAADLARIAEWST